MDIDQLTDKLYRAIALVIEAEVPDFDEDLADLDYDEEGPQPPITMDDLKQDAKTALRESVAAIVALAQPKP